MSCDAGGDQLTISRDRLQTSPILLSEAAISGVKGSFGGNTGYSRKRAPSPENPPRVLRYYDLNLDYQPGSQRAPGQAMGGQPKTIELPAAMAASDAFQLISHTSRCVNWARDTIAWRSAQLDTTVAPGAIVTMPGHAGNWRVNDWEWRADGVELTLERVAPSGVSGNGTVSAGRANLAADLAMAQTRLVAFELPWDGIGGGDTTALFAAVSSTNAQWSGSGLYVDTGDGALTPIGASGRQRSTIGTATNALGVASSFFAI